MTSQAPVVERIRIIPRPQDFLNRNVGASGEIFFNKDSNSLRVYSGKKAGGFEIAKADLSNILDSDFLTKATNAGVGSTVGESTADVSPTEPESPILGSLWFDNTTNQLYVYVIDEAGSQWTQPETTVDLTGYATQTYVDDAISAIVAPDNSTIIATEFSLGVAADDSSIVQIRSGESIKFIGAGTVTTASDAEGNITISSTAGTSFATLSDVASASLTIDKIYEPAMIMLAVDNVGTSAYTFNSHYTGSNPTLYFLSGTTVAFNLAGATGHPFLLQDSTGSNLTTNIVHVTTDGVVTTDGNAQGKDSGTLYWRIPENLASPPNYRYQCGVHAAMVGAIAIRRLSSI